MPLWEVHVEEECELIYEVEVQMVKSTRMEIDGRVRTPDAFMSRFGIAFPDNSD